MRKLRNHMTKFFRVSAASAIAGLALWVPGLTVYAQPGGASGVINVRDYGASGDARSDRADVAGNVVTGAGTRFQPQDVGKLIVLEGSGSNPHPRVAHISAVLDGSRVRLVESSSDSLHDVGITWGTDDREAVLKALAAVKAKGNGSTLYFPGGIYLIGYTGFQVDTSDVSITGDGPQKSVLATAFLQGPMFTITGARVKVSRLGFELGGLAFASGLSLKQATSIEVDACRFFSPGAIGVGLDHADRVKVHDSVFDSPGDAVGTGILIESSSQIEVRRCNFRYLNNGVIAHVVKGEAAPAQDVGIYDNHFDLGWWLTVPRYSGSGPSVSYTQNSIVDSEVIFTELKQYATVRSLRPLVSGNGSFTQNALNNAQGRFLSSGARRGDLIRTGNLIAVVAEVPSETELVVEEWMGNVDRIPTLPPSSGSYTIYRCLIGKVVSAADHVIRVDAWRDWTGSVQTPASGSRYEASANRGNYTIHAEPGSRNFHVENNAIEAGYSDQISMWGDGATVHGNTIRDGEDMGITLNGTAHVVTENKIEHQGAGGVWVSCVGCQILRNSVSDTPWVNPNYSDGIGGIILYAAQRNTVSDNIISSRPEMALRRFGLLVSQRNNSDPPVTGNVIERNQASGHALADILLSGIDESANKIQGNSGVVRRKSAGSQVLQ